MINKTQHKESNNRIYFLDNLRTIIIFLVVLYHVGGIYEGNGDWEDFWLVDDPDTSEISLLVNIVLDIFLMPTLFFVSGFLAPISLKKKGSRKFIYGKFRRLMVPWLIAVFTLIPLYKMIFLYSRDLPQENWTSYFYLSSDIVDVGMAWLWFLPVLFIFMAAYALLAKWIPSQMSFKKGLAVVFAFSFLSNVGLDIADALGWTHTPLADFQNERVLMYFAVFLLGTLAFHQEIFATLPERPPFYRMVKFTVWIPFISYMVFLIGRTEADDEAFILPVIDQIGFWLSFYLFLMSILYLMFIFFWRRINRPGKLWNELNRNSYNVYIIHVIVLGVVALPLLDVSLSGEIKYILVTALTYVICNILVSFNRTITQSQGRLYPTKSTLKHESTPEKL